MNTLLLFVIMHYAIGWTNAAIYCKHGDSNHMNLCNLLFIIFISPIALYIIIGGVILTAFLGMTMLSVPAAILLKIFGWGALGFITSILFIFALFYVHDNFCPIIWRRK